jgi:hypothetical protein
MPANISIPLPLPIPAIARAPGIWPVWSGSTTKPVQFSPLPKKQAARIWHKARAHDRTTRTAGSGKHGGALGRVALNVLYALLFDFLNFTTGQLDPSHAAIARKAGCCETAVKLALKKLKALGFLHWVRRARPVQEEGRGFLLRQETNAYAVLPPDCWHGYHDPEPPPPEPWQWGARPPLPGALELAAIEAREGGGIRAQIAALESEPGEYLAAALASLGRAVFGTKP